MRQFDQINFSSLIHSPEELATNVLQAYFNGETPIYPIDPFKIMREFGIIYQFRDFSKLEGVYLVPEDIQDIPFVGININRPLTRQRFTAAHEICHHIKDRNSIFCPIYNVKKNALELFADKFAAALLMPSDEISKISNEYQQNGFVEFDSGLYIAEYFGVSFEACIYRLAYKFNKISGSLDSLELRKRIKKFKPDAKRLHLGIEKQDISQLRNILNCYEFSLHNESKIVWYKFKINFVYNENRLEGVNIGYDEVSEIITDLRMNRQNSNFCTSEFQTIIEVAGHSSLYDYIHTTTDPISTFMLLKLNQLMYQYSPHPEASGFFRDTNNLVIASKFESCDYRDISSQIFLLDKELKSLMIEMNTISISEFIEAAVRIHHKLTVIHPFADGNGRISRAFLNWLFRLRKLPPVYIKIENKQKYFDALSLADQIRIYEPLYEIFYHEILRSMIELNSKFR